MVKSQKSALEERRSLYISTLNALRDKELEFTQKAKEEAEKRKDFNKSTEDWLRELSYKTMSSQQAEEAKFELAREQASEARKLYLAGEFELAKKKYAESMETYKSAEGGLRNNSANIGEYVQKVGDIAKEVIKVN